MTTTNAELIEVANGFKASMIAAKTDDPEPGSILDLWLRTAAALESATTVTDARVQRLREACYAQGLSYPTITEATTILTAALTEGERR